MLKRTHFSELSISRFTTRKRSQRPHDPRSEKSKLKMTGRPLSTNSIVQVKPTLSRSLLPKVSNDLYSHSTQLYSPQHATPL